MPGGRQAARPRRADGQKVLLAVKSMGGESAQAWRGMLDDLIRRGLRRPEFRCGLGQGTRPTGASGLDSAIRCTVHKHRNLLAHAPERLHEEITEDYNNMIYAETSQQIEARRKAFIRKWRIKHRPAADSPEEAGARLSASPACRRNNGGAPALPMPSNGCTRSSRADQDTDRAAFRRRRGDVILGVSGIRPDQHAQSRWMEDSRPRGCRSGK
jgi:Transposase, Mutator family